MAAMKRGGTNIFNVEDSCGLPDRVEGELRYQGGTSRSVDINNNGSCSADAARA